MTQEELSRTLKRWQKRIRLISAWKISIRFATADELASADWKDTYALLSNCDRTTATADIIVRHPDAYGSLKVYPIDETVLHELAHIIVDHHPRETAMNCIAETIYHVCPKTRVKKIHVT